MDCLFIDKLIIKADFQWDQGFHPGCNHTGWDLRPQDVSFNGARVFALVVKRRRSNFGDVQMASMELGLLPWS